ncbi:MAG: hypothetical protein LUB61_05990 [Eggerthellaceae bacterium]|nr:hypothetical protein [Eggerthellaceae bacterium]
MSFLRAAITHGITYMTTLCAAQAVAAGMDAANGKELGILVLQDIVPHSS